MKYNNYNRYNHYKYYIGLNRILAIVMLLAFTTSTFLPAYAQEASNSATPQASNQPSSPSAQLDEQKSASPSGDLPSPTPTPAPISRIPENEDSPFTSKKASDLLSLDFDEPVIMSAVVKQPIHIQTLSKKDYLQTEAVTVTIDNVTRETVAVTLFDTNDLEVETPITLIDNGETVMVHIQPPKELKPGKYILQAVDADDQMAEVSFTWGVLSLNTDKTVYRTGEKISMFMGVTDEQGNIECDAKVSITISDPDKKVTVLSTEDDTITTNLACKDHGASLQADYETGFMPTVPGLYELTMKAETSQGTYSLAEKMQVQTEELPYTIRRSMPTRIFPTDPFAVTLDITANKDFTGTIRDIAPGDFTLTPSTSSATLEQITNRVSSASAQRRDFSGYPIGQLRIPFDDEHPLSLDFGGTIQDPLLKNLYKNFGLLGHDGLDFAMPIGTPLLSTDAGTVLWAGPGDYGETIIIEHTWGRSYYGHLSKVGVSVGQFVAKGAAIGLSGNTGISTGPHLHFGIKPTINDTHNGYYGKIDPLPFLTLSDNSKILSAKTAGDLQSVKLISWDVSLKQGESVSLVYMMKASERHPAVHIIGPVQFLTKNAEGTEETIVQSDTRLWQTVADQAPVLGAQVVAESNRSEHYKMQSIDPALFNVPEGYPIRVASFGSDIKGAMSVTRINKEQPLTTFIVKDSSGSSHAANFTLLNTLPHETIKTNYTLSRKDIFPNVDMDYTTHDGYIQQVLTIKTEEARREFEIAMNLSNDMSIKDMELAGGHVVITDKATGEELMTLRYPQGIDDKNQRIDYKYRLENNKLVLYPNRAWQYDQAIYPIKVYMPINAVAWDEAAVTVGDGCIDGKACERDGDVMEVRPAGWHWGINTRQEHVVVKIDKMKPDEQIEAGALTIKPERDDETGKLKEYKGNLKERLAAYDGMKRFGIDYTQLAASGQLNKIRDKKKKEYAPFLDARKKKNVLKRKSNLITSVINTEKKLAYIPPKKPNLFQRLAKSIFRPASAATIQTATIGSAGGRDFTDPQTWETANDNDLVAGDIVEKGEMYKDSAFVATGTPYLAIKDAVTDATRYMWVTVATSDRHNGTAGTGAILDCNDFAGGVTGINVSTNYTHVDWLEITQCRGSSGISGIIVQNDSTNVVLEYLLLYDLEDASNSNAAVRTSSSGTDSFTIRNSIIYDYDEYAVRGNGAADTITVENLTIWGNTTESGDGVSDNSSTMTVRNTIAMNTTSADFTYGASGTASNNMSQDATADDVGSNHKINQSTSGQFVSTTGGSENFHLVSTSTAIDGGTSSVGLTDDIDAFTREGTFDIGADEFPNPPLIRLMRHGKYFGANGTEQPFTF